MVCSPVAVWGQSDTLIAIQFAEKPAVDAPDSIEFFAQYFREKDDLEYWLKLYLNAGRECLFVTQKHEDGIRFLDQAVHAWRMPQKIGEWQVWAKLNLNLGYAYHVFTGDFVRARIHYETARAVFQDTLRQENVYLAERVLIPLGNIYARFRDFEKSFYYLNQAKDLCIRLKANEQAAVAINGIGLKFTTKGEWLKSMRCFEEGLALADLSMENVVQLSLNLAQSLIYTGQLDSAYSISIQCRNLLEQNPDSFAYKMRLEHWADLHDDLGLIAQKQMQWDKAAYHFGLCTDFYIQKTGDTNNRLVAQCYLKLADVFADWGRPDSALHYAQTALRCLLPNATLADDWDNPSKDSLYSENTLSSVFRQKIRAIQAMAFAHPEDLSLIERCLENCDLLFTTDEILRQEYAFEGSRLYRQAINHEYYEIALWACYRLQQLTNDPSLEQRALQYSEQARERLMAESYQEHEAEAMSKMPAQDRQRLYALQTERARLQVLRFEKTARGEEDTPAADSLESLLFETHLAAKSLLEPYIGQNKAQHPAPPETDINSLQALLRPDQALLEYFVGDSAVYLFTVTQNKVQFFNCGRPDSLESNILALRRALTGAELQFSRKGTVVFGQSASMLYRFLLKEALSTLPASVNKLVFVPDGLLGYVPFEVLGETQGRVDFSAFPYLIRRFTVSYACSGKILLAQHARAVQVPQNLEPFAGFAPKYAADVAGEALASRTRATLLQGERPNLPGALKEVKSIAALLGGKAYTGEEATEQQFKKQWARYRILHFAMHAYTEPRNPLCSKMLFTSTPKDLTEDGDLNLAELYPLRLPTEMAVLSACETGLGEWRKGEGIESFSRAFAQAGVASTVVSLWAVSDLASSQIMTDFYKSLKTGLRKDEALRQAKLQYLSQAEALSASPYYWAGFVASGEMRPLFGP